MDYSFEACHSAQEPRPALTHENRQTSGYRDPTKARIGEGGSATAPDRIFSLNETKLLNALSLGALAALVLGCIVGTATMNVSREEYVVFGFSAACFGMTPWIIAKTKSPSAGALILLLGALGPVFVPAYHQEGIRSPYLIWFVVIPMLAPLFLGVRFSMIALFVGLAGFTMLYARELIDPVGATGVTVPLFFFYFNLVLATIFGTLVGGATLRANIRIRRDLDGLERDIETKAADIEDVNARRAAVLNSSQSGIVSCDADGVVTDFNPAAQSLFGYSQDEAIGRKVRDLIIPSGMIAKHNTGFERYLATGEARILGRPLELVGLCGNGDEIPVEVLVQRIDLPGEPQFTAFLRDLRQQRESEAMLRQRESQLQKARRLEDVGRLAAGIAHDFNNLLTIVSGYSESIAELAEADSTIREDALEIANAAERAAVITNQLLAFSRSQTLELRALDPSVLLRDFETTLRTIVPSGINLGVEIPDFRFWIDADTSQLERVLMNIVLNACDAMNGEGRLEVSLSYLESVRGRTKEHSLLPSGRYACLECRDEGAGMDADTLSHAFEPFFTTKEVGKGTGLGLATVYGIVQQCGGTVEIDSEPGCGTTVRIFLPESKEEIVQSVSADGSPAGEKATVLVVDDESGVRSLIAKCLRLDSFRVLEAADGQEALRIMEREGDNVNLVISDLIMPIKSGAELVAEISSGHPKVKFIVMSGYFADETARIDSGNQQMVFLQKPVRMKEISRTVSRILGRGADRVAPRSV